MTAASSQAQLVKAQRLAEHGDAQGALAIFRSVTDVVSDWRVSFYIAYLEACEKNYDAGITTLIAALDSKVMTEEGNYNCGQLLADIQVARAAHRRITELPPNFGGIGIRDYWEKQAIASLSEQLGPPRDSPLTVAFFHIDGGADHPYIDTKTVIDYHAVLNTACQAVRKTNPQARTVILTDDTSNLSTSCKDVVIIRLPVDSRHMMYSRMRAYRALAMSKTVSGPLLFLDTDVLLQRTFDPAMLDGNDVVMTYRTNMGFWHMPINEGLILALDGASESLARFFGKSLEIYETIAADPTIEQRYGFSVKAWRGGQLSIAGLIGWRVPPFSPDTLSIDEIRIKLLSGTDYNYAVKSDDPVEKLEGKWALHFKGAEAKGLIERYTGWSF